MIHEVPSPLQPNQPKLFYGTVYSKLNNKISHFPIYCLCFRNWKLLTCTETPLNLSNVSQFFFKSLNQKQKRPPPTYQLTKQIIPQTNNTPQTPPPLPTHTTPRKKPNNSNTFNESTSKNRITKSFI